MIEIEKLQNLVIDENQRLEKLKLFLSQPNYLEILGISHRELQHSNFLAWMMNSRASHDIGNYFLKSFINLLPLPPEDKIRINLSNLEGTKIHREFNDIDLLIVNTELKFTICIENKIKASKSGDNQLLKYYEIVENTWSDKEHKNYYVYLTPFPRTLTEKEIEIEYVNLTYQSILDILEDTVISKRPSEETTPLIDNYINNLKKNIMGISEEAKLAQEIYKKHKTAIDFIVNNKPTLYSPELFGQINDFFIQHEQYQNLTPKDKNIIRVLPLNTIPYFNHKTNSWDGTQSSFALEIFCEREKIWIKFCFGAINTKSEEERHRLQKIKDDAFSGMKEFKSISSKIIRRSKSSSGYPSVANFDIVKLNDKVFSETEDVFSAFKLKFQKFEKNTLEKWSDEVEQKITKAQQNV
ncbi:PD-(D/E)XK nuclease superfamily protein [Aquimarina sp. MAR_2010_214]|uniref:PDDEXK-like family protein n=1 Tax=Aquimarina sp. MAR_2010_214 TaxID=1250026 RepID=UPI000C709A60|nr:PD-(D/E)XK nuclease family protein [Aquimarina sp. MAR_2010_214]PKV51720.1 PD-(D/E)XK nuclease superfamily protein [Aquimarina sp. MAR_2010_214]